MKIVTSKELCPYRHVQLHTVRPLVALGLTHAREFFGPSLLGNAEGVK